MKYYPTIQRLEILISQNKGSHMNQSHTNGRSEGFFARRSNVVHWDKALIADNLTWLANGETSEI